jgi:divalent metal cation (Fe/Co/Zn/Cd) transporter
LIADGIHSLSDLVADFVVLLPNRHSQKDADADLPHGHQRFETAASLALGVILLALGALVAKELLFRYMLSVAKRVKSSMAAAAFA